LIILAAPIRQVLLFIKFATGGKNNILLYCSKKRIIIIAEYLKLLLINGFWLTRRADSIIHISKATMTVGAAVFPKTRINSDIHCYSLIRGKKINEEPVMDSSNYLHHYAFMGA